MESKNSSNLQISASVMATNSFEVTSNPPGSIKSFSNFGDSACGEPLLAQHLIIDYTPKTETDTEFIQKKVCAFWDFVRMKPELRDIIVFPEPDMFKRSSSSDMSTEVVRSESTKSSDSKVLTKQRTAVSMLEFVEERGLIDRTFESRLPQSLCSLGSREYHVNEVPVQFQEVLLQKKEKCGSLYRRQIKYNKRTQTVDSRPVNTGADVSDLWRKTRQWDKQHPKSMNRPKHSYSSHRIIQKNIST